MGTTSSYPFCMAVSVFALLSLLMASASVQPAAANSLAGWHSRAIPHPQASHFVPSSENFAFGVIRSTQVNPSGFLVAFFLPDFVVDAAGRTLQLAAGEWDRISTLAHDAVKRPQPGGFQNQWRIAQDRTSWPILQLHVKHGEESVVSVYGFDGKTDLLDPPAAGRTTLPPSLMEAFSLLLEALQPSGKDQKNAELVKNLVKILDAN
ncbi:hypothetical protein BV898_00412 [Hypsibius exemplaris]|uniref:Uncharacterized protein n=1 Tax=Hypsibius exemplaris TaxID=2072580 RepID=A0A1W0XDQ2_HYPEX|nr:hypothetical protein BV898_00412 [Hypsibius exemplaris]